MPTLTLAEAFTALFPEASIGVVAVRGLDNRRGADEAAAMLSAQSAETAAALPDADLGQLPAIAVWRAAYARFGVKPSKVRSSIENLLRAVKADRLRSVNPLVDISNAVSLRHLLPAGGEDLGTIVGDIRLTRAAGDEHFVPLGGLEPEPPPAGAVIYRDDAGVICSCWNWREAERTKLTADTTDALLAIEALPPVERAHLEAALADLAERVMTHLGGAAQLHVLDRERTRVEL